MAKGCFANISKFVLFGFNFIIWLFSVGLLALGIFLLLNKQIPEELESARSLLKVAAWVLIVVGSITFIITFFGCCGAIREIPCFLSTYMAFMVLFITGQVSLAIYIGITQPKLSAEMTKQFAVQQEKYSKDDNAKNMIDLYQYSAFQCCGLNKWSDWGSSVPASCCRGLKGTFEGGKFIYKSSDAKTCAKEKNYFSTPCKEAIQNSMKKIVPILIAILVVLAVIELFGCLLAFYIIRNIHKGYAAANSA